MLGHIVWMVGKKMKDKGIRQKKGSIVNSGGRYIQTYKQERVFLSLEQNI